jgi:hypothetical protein
VTIVLGWLLLIAGIAGVIWVLRARVAAIAASGRSDAPAAPSRGHYAGVVAAIALGLWLVAVGAGATARLTPTHSWDFSRDPEWLIQNKEAIRWDSQSGALNLTMTPGSGAYGVAPVDWNAGRFRAEFDIEITSLRNPDLAVVGVGLFDGSISNIHDRDHVGGSTIQASIGNDVRLVVSDANLLTRSDPLPGGEASPLRLELNKVYHVALGYDRRIDTATLEVTEKGAGQPLVQLKVEELRDFTPNVAYFGVSMKGYNKGKDLDPSDPQNPQPTVEATLDNVAFLQP